MVLVDGIYRDAFFFSKEPALRKTLHINGNLGEVYYDLDEGLKCNPGLLGVYKQRTTKE